MAFSLKTTDVVGTPPIEYLKATASETYTVGEALSLAAGRVTKCGATAVPMYICAGQAASASADSIIPCYRVSKNQVYDTTLSASGSALNVGDKVTISADGLSVTATTASGVAEITGIDSTAVGGSVSVRF